MNARRRLGVIGCGAVVQTNYLPALAYYPDIHFARVTDLNAEAAAHVAAVSGAEASSLDQIMADCEIVIVATPPGTHRGLVEQVLADGRTVICEKPFVGEKADAEALASLAADRKSKLFVAHFRRCFPSVRLGRALIESGILGHVTRVSAYEGGRFSWQSKSSYVYKDPHGGVLFDTGSHTLDMLLYVACLDTGSLKVTSARTERDRPEPSNELEAHVSISREGHEIPGHFKLSRIGATANKILVECDNGFVELPVGLANYVRIGKQDGRAVIVHARESYADLMECFALQLKEMFFPDEDRTFAAERFINLTDLLESVNDG
ncbi:Gfo/Idh/MocA family oxidoreductase [Mycobacterium sp. RTGN5]|uniref:Gfo/Idh/MocA family protein n=1 Tax=Mycobacterium sp. RTGN5 TaxID=3016522 RepID=UPI0029C8E3EB|nr:Gfo/Idh/MocA family oxidoreductase [Mycobacterium sp. RTGN5]